MCMPLRILINLIIATKMLRLLGIKDSLQGCFCNTYKIIIITHYIHSLIKKKSAGMSIDQYQQLFVTFNRTIKVCLTLLIETNYPHNFNHSMLDWQVSTWIGTKNYAYTNTCLQISHYWLNRGSLLFHTECSQL